MIVGLVLAGGRSSRFGSEKAVARLDGRPLLEWTLDVLRPACDRLAVGAAEGSEAAALAARLGLAVLPDDPAHQAGPLAGVSAGLRWAAGQGGTHLATLPCDTPHVPGELVFRLIAEGGEAFAAWARTSGGDHPLCALWSIDLLAPLESTLARGHPAVRRFLADVGGVPVDFDDPAAFANINTPGDL